MKKKTGPKPENGVGMVRLRTGMWVGRDVLPLLTAWRAHYGVPLGRSLTAALRFAARHPDFSIPLNGRKL